MASVAVFHGATQISPAPFKNSFRVIWHGQELPGGFKVGGIDIATAKNGFLNGINGEKIGRYSLEIGYFSAPSAEVEREMIIKTNYDQVTPPAGGSAEPI